MHIDLTPPVVLLTNTPSAISNQTSSVFTFNCPNERQCAFRCDVHLVGESPQFSTCFGSWQASNLQDGVNYVFSVFAIDDVGNTGSVETYMWKIGKSSITLQ